VTGDQTGSAAEARSHGRASAAPVATRPDQVRAEISLASYVEALAPADFTVAAKAEVLAEVRSFAADLCKKTATYQELDENAEAALRKHVRSAARSMEQRTTKTTDGRSKISDWCKWVGFAFFAFAVGQFQRVTGEKPIDGGSVKWLVADIIITVLLLVVGFMIDKPLEAAARVFRRKSRSAS
jgi:hypothetical protein